MKIHNLIYIWRVKANINQTFLCQVAGLQRRVIELEEAQSLEKESQQQRDASLQESHRRQREEMSRLEAALQEVQAELREQSVELRLAESRGRSLEEQLTHADASRSDLEHRLSGLASALRRTLGIGCRARSPTLGTRGRRPSPWRNRSPEKGTAKEKRHDCNGQLVVRFMKV